MDSALDLAISFDTDPARYRHWTLDFPVEHGGAVARLTLDVKPDGGLVPGYALKLNSYDLGVDIELADALTRLRFEHPEAKALLFRSAHPKVFCSGANIYMLGTSTHAFKVNFCKFTNETRLGLEELSADSGVASLAAVAGACAGGGYELAIACDEIVLQDDGSTAVSLPEVPLLGVLPGTGGLTRLVDKRKVRRDLADVFATLAEGVRGQRAVAWGLVDEAVERSAFDAAVRARLDAMVARSARLPAPPIKLASSVPRREGSTLRWRWVTLALDRAARVATLTMRAPDAPPPATSQALAAAGGDTWALAAFRDLDAALLELRTNVPEVGVVVLKTEGAPSAVLASDRALLDLARTDGLAREIVLHTRRVLRRLDVTSRSFFALVEPGSCFAGSLLELALAADRSYMLDAGAASPTLAVSAMNAGPLTMLHGITRLASRFLGQPGQADRVAAAHAPFDTQAALAAGLVTFAPDEIDWDDEVRVALEERASLSPDALTGMEASLRFGGVESMATKVFGRLSAWQNWIFQRPNAVGPRGALTMYGKPERAEFDWKRV